jgi:protein gp37
MATTKIEWTDATWNPFRGCTKISPGCKHCYAETFAERFRGVAGHPYERGFDPRFVPEALETPIRWRKPRRIFVNSMSDLFHESFTVEQIDSVFAVMQACPQHEFQILTKRPESLARWFVGAELRVYDAGRALADKLGWCHAHEGDSWLANVRFGVSCETQEIFEERCLVMWAMHGLYGPRWFISFEPLLGPIDFHSYRGRTSWVIVGAESGRGARPFDLDWARSIRDVCQAYSIPFFFKQVLDERGRKVSLPLLDGVRWTQFPEVSG